MEPPEAGAPSIFAMADPARIKELVNGAGFGSLELREVRMSWDFDSFDSFWTYLTELVGVVARVLAELDPREVAEVRADTQSGLDHFRSDAGYELPGVCINGLAR